MPQKAKVTADKTQPAEHTRVQLNHPVSVVLKRGKGKNKDGRRERTSSRGARRLTDIDRRVSRALRRITRAVDHGVDTYRSHRNKSRDKRRDGAVVDFLENVSYGVSQAVSEASPVLHDVGEAINTRRMRKQIRRVARSFANVPLFG